MKYFYDILLVGYFGIEKILERIKNKFYWFVMKKFVENYINICFRCFVRKKIFDKRVVFFRQYLVGEFME